MNNNVSPFCLSRNATYWEGNKDKAVYSYLNLVISTVINKTLQQGLDSMRVMEK